MKRLLFFEVRVTDDSTSLGYRRVPVFCLMLTLLAGLSACSFAPTWPPLPLPDTMTREQVEHFRALEQERLQNALRECYQRFAVNNCRREAMTRHNEVQHQLRAQELRLNALDREERQRKLQTPPANEPAGLPGLSTGPGVSR